MLDIIQSLINDDETIGIFTLSNNLTILNSNVIIYNNIDTIQNNSLNKFIVVDDYKNIDKLFSILLPGGSLNIMSHKQVNKTNCLLAGFVDFQESDNIFSMKKPNYNLGTSAAIWKLDLTDDELIDQDDLLEDIPIVKPNNTSKKICKNCVCGLRQQGCGNCHKGEAFRCAGCPF